MLLNTLYSVFSLHRLRKSFGYAFKGIYLVCRSERNMQFHLCAVAVVMVMAFLWQLSAIECCLILLCIAVVLMAELFNSAVEKLTDLVSPDYNVQAGMVKDIAAGAVLIASIGSALVAAIIFLPKMYVSLLELIQK